MSKDIRSRSVSLPVLSLLAVVLLANIPVSVSLNQTTQQAPITADNPASAAIAREITGCTVISIPGVYVLTQDISGTYSGQNWCIKIVASNVILDGQGHSLTGSGKDWTAGIVV